MSRPRRLTCQDLRIYSKTRRAVRLYEVAVAAYLQEGIRFPEIAHVISTTMEAHTSSPLHTLHDALEADRWAREKASALVHSLTK